MDENKTPKSDLQSEIDSQMNQNKQTGKETTPFNAPSNLQNIQTDNLPPLPKSNTMPGQKTVSSEQKTEIVEPKKDLAEGVQIDAVRTYKGDLNTFVKDEGVSSAKILMAEQKHRDKEEGREIKVKKTNTFKGALSIVLILATLGAAGFGTYYFLNQEEGVPNQFTLEKPKFFAIDNFEYLDSTNISVSDFINKIQAFNTGQFAEGRISQLVFFENYFEGSVELQRELSFEQFVRTAQISPPSILRRSLADDYMFGVYSFNSQNSPFVIFKVLDFENAYSSIFEYENRMVADFRNVLGGFPEFSQIISLQNQLELLPVETATTTATSTTTESATTTSTTTQANPRFEIQNQILATQNKINSYRNFIDIVLQNTDSRAVLDENREVIFYYTFIDRQWLLVAKNTEVLREAKRRIRERTLLR